MTYLRCTQKLLKLLGREALAASRTDTSSESSDDWYANLIWIQRRKCLLFTNVGTLFPLLVFDVKKAQVSDLASLFREQYMNYLPAIGVSAQIIATEIGSLESLQIGRSRNRRVLGSMNDYAWMAQLYVEQHGGVYAADPVIVSSRVGESPMSAIEYSSGCQELLRKLMRTAM